MSKAKSLIAGLALALSIAGPAGALQSRSTVQGFVTDDSGAAAPGVNVELRDLERGQSPYRRPRGTPTAARSIPFSIRCYSGSASADRAFGWFSPGAGCLPTLPRVLPGSGCGEPGEHSVPAAGRRHRQPAGCPEQAVNTSSRRRIRYGSFIAGQARKFSPDGGVPRSPRGAFDNERVASAGMTLTFP